MSRTVPPVAGKVYGIGPDVPGLARGSGVYRHRQQPHGEPPRRPGPIGPMADAAPVPAIRTADGVGRPRGGWRGPRERRRSFRQPGLAQALRPAGEVLRSAEGAAGPSGWRAAGPDRAAQPRHGLRGLGLGRRARPRRQRRRRDEEARLLSQRRLGPGRSFGVAAREEMRAGGRGLHGEHLRIVRAQAHGARGMLDRGLRLAETRP